VHPTPVEILFWRLGLLGHCILLVILLVRHRAKMFKVFTVLIGTNIVRSVALYVVHLHAGRVPYLDTYFSFALVDFSLQIGVVWEIAAKVFRPTGVWAADTRAGTLILLAVFAVVALAIASMPAPPERRLLKDLLDRGNLLSSVLVCELFLGMVALSIQAHLPWKTHAARIAQGLGCYSLIGLLTAGIHNVTGLVRRLPVSHELSVFREATYLVCLVYWIVTLWANGPPPRELPPEMRRFLFEIESSVEYNLAKLRLLKK